MARVDKVLIGEALVGDGKEVAHVDLIMGPRGSAAETAFCTALTNQKPGANALLALVAPNLMTKPATVIFNKVTIENERQAGRMFGPAQRGIAKAVADCVKEGIIPKDEVENIYICIAVFIHWEAQDNNKIQDWNYEATKLAIKRAMMAEPHIDDVIANEEVMHHPLEAHG